MSHLSPNIFLNTFSTVSHLYCLSFLTFHCLMSLHDGRTQKVSWAAKVLLYSGSNQSSLKASTAVSHLSPNIFLNTFSNVSHLYCLSFLKFHCPMSLHEGRTQKVSYAANRLVNFEGIYCSDWPVFQPLSQHFLNCLTSVLSLLSHISLSHLSTWWQNPKSVLSRK